MYGVGFAAALVAVLCGLTFPRRERWLASGAAIVALLGIGAGLATIEWTQPVGKPVSVSLLQGNIEQSLKWKPERLQQSLETYLRLARAHPAQLIVLPETALPLMFDQLPRDYVAALRRPAQDRKGDVLLGIAAQDAQGRYYNSAVGFAQENIQFYRKSHLVPFGEFTPPAFAWTLALLKIPMSNFSPGAAAQPPLALAGQKVAVNICYEDVFGGGDHPRPAGSDPAREPLQHGLVRRLAGAAAASADRSRCAPWKPDGPCCAPPIPA
ncbi:MAG: apolipoprotein N-acyltransferase [Rhodocyclaceae bacterium]|nr:apolipoprotein N-acyltransferase [Rhodocyclaceae bacterium]